jgi:nitroimidazol reductase NimA-like FMN-containing flavoprotein (pyridoxamine 5'-phosphate oxidase superfamily)
MNLEHSTSNHPTGELHPQFSSKGAVPTSWANAVKLLSQAEIFWLSTLRGDGQPHVTPLVAVWQDSALHFCTGPEEQKAQNLIHNPNCVLTTGNNILASGTDLVIEGTARRVSDDAALQRLSDAFQAKYPAPFDFSVDDLKELHVYRVAPKKAFGFGRGEAYSQTRWRF